MALMQFPGRDTTLSASAAVSDLPAVQQRLQEDLNEIVSWTSENRMVLSRIHKIKALLVTGKHLEKKIPDKALKTACNGREIEQVISEKLLGLKLDSQLNFTGLIDSLCKKSDKGLLYLQSPGQTIATCQRNILQHCWAQHVACVWPPCCDMLGVVGSNLTIFKLEPISPNMSQHGGQTHATC